MHPFCPTLNNYTLLMLESRSTDLYDTDLYDTDLYDTDTAVVLRAGVLPYHFIISSGDQMQTFSEAALQVWHDVVDMGIFSTAPVLIALLYICLCSFLKEPTRRNFNAIMVAGAGAAYLNGGFGIWEFAFTSVMTFFAYKGLQSYSMIGIAWMLHTAWDVLHHLYGNLIVPFAPNSSLGCFICDPVIALTRLVS